MAFPALGIPQLGAGKQEVHLQSLVRLGSNQGGIASGRRFDFFFA